MGDRLPEDAFAYHYEDPICTMESHYWNFLLEKFILSANDVYNHCLATQNLNHIKEILTVSQNLAYDFCNLTEYLNLRRAGINAPLPNRNTFNITPAADYYENGGQLEHSHPKCKNRHSKKGTNIKAPPFIPSLAVNLQQQQQQPNLGNYVVNRPIQQLPADGGQYTMPEQSWAQIVPQQITLPHYHIPYTNLVHYPIGNIYTHQITQNYPAFGDADVHHNKLPQDCDNYTKNTLNQSEEHEINRENLVAHTGVQVELSVENSHMTSEDVDLTQGEINVNKLLTTFTSDSQVSEEKLARPPETEVFDENASNVVEKSSTNLNLETSKLKNMSRCSTPIKELFCLQLEDEFEKYEKCDDKETELRRKSSYKDVLMKGICSLEEIDKETSQQETTDCSEADQWKQVIRRKSSNLDVKSCGSANRYNAAYTCSKMYTAKKSHFSKIGNRRRQNIQEVYAKTSNICNNNNRTASRTLTQNRSLTTTTTKWQDDLEQESKVDDDEEEVDEKYDDVKIVKQPTLTINNKLTKTSDNIDANSANIRLLNRNNKTNQETNLIEEFEKNLTIEFNEPLQITIKPKEWQIRKISTKKRRNNGDLNICEPQITDESNVTQMDSSIEETNIDSNLSAEMCMDVSQEYSKSGDNVETAETSDDPLSLLTSESPPSYELSCSPDRLIGSETLMHDNSITEIFDTNPAAGLYVSCDQNIDDDEYENAMLQLLSPTNASFYDFLSSITPENTDSKENYRQLFNDFTEYFNSLPVTAQKEEMDILRKIFFENVEVACSFRISTIEEFELLFAENPNAACQLENHINSKLRQIRESETKQQLAHEKRLQLLECKTARVREQVQKVEEAKAAKYKLALQRKSQIDLKLKKAEENRKMYLSIIRKKAHDEEEKLKEIAFINELEAQNRRHDSLALRQEHEGRLQILIEERQRRLEEKAAKEAAVEERRRMLEAERQEKLEKMKEKRRRKEEIIDRKQQEREKERLVIAREKAREREERLQARKEAHLATVEELQKRIQQKQEESARRHEENIELIRQKALEVGLHRSILDDVNHQEDSEAINNLPKDKSKINVKRRYKKIRARLMQRGDEFLRKCNFIQQDLMSLNCGPLVEMINELSSFAVDDLLLVENNVHTVERMLTEVSLIMERKVDALVLYIFIFSKGIVILGKFLEAFIHLPAKKVSVYKWILEKIIKIYNVLVHEDADGFKYVVGSNGLMLLFELLNYSVGMLTTNMKFFPELTEKILITSKIALKNMSLTSDSETSLPYYKSLIADLISYILTCGLTTKIPELFQVAVISEGGQLNDLIPKFVDFLAALVHKSFLSVELIRTLKATDCLGTVPLLYEGIQKMSPANSLPIYARSVIQLLLSFAKLDIGAFQETLGAEGMALQMRAIASLLMSYCSMNRDYDNMLQDVIEMVGYFAVYNLENQSLIQSGQQPTILQQLVSLPFNYFRDPIYKWKLFPTLIVCSHNNATNRAIVENECSYRELESFIETPNIEDEIPLLKIFLDKRRQESGDAAKENPLAQQ